MVMLFVPLELPIVNDPAGISAITSLPPLATFDKWTRLHSVCPTLHDDLVI